MASLALRVAALVDPLALELEFLPVLDHRGKIVRSNPCGTRPRGVIRARRQVAPRKGAAVTGWRTGSAVGRAARHRGLRRRAGRGAVPACR